jgi:hypothetical protein
MAAHSRPAPPRGWRPAALAAAGDPGAGGHGDPGERRERDPARAWLRGAMAALGVLAAAAAVVSWDAQFVMVREARRVTVIAAVEAAIPDAGALIFASLAIALALHGRRALRPRALNLACVGVSLAMNALAAGRGWRDVTIWVMPAAVYALASDTLIGVVRAWALARMRPGARSLDGEEVTPLAVAGAVVLWLLRLGLAPASTLSGFRRWVIEDCPVAPGRRELPGRCRDDGAVRTEGGVGSGPARNALVADPAVRRQAGHRGRGERDQALRFRPCAAPVAILLCS